MTAGSRGVFHVPHPLPSAATKLLNSGGWICLDHDTVLPNGRRVLRRSCVRFYWILRLSLWNVVTFLERNMVTTNDQQMIISHKVFNAQRIRFMSIRHYHKKSKRLFIILKLWTNFSSSPLLKESLAFLFFYVLIWHVYLSVYTLFTDI